MATGDVIGEGLMSVNRDRTTRAAGSVSRPDCRESSCEVVGDVSVLLRHRGRERQQAWRSVIEEFKPMIWTIAKSFGLVPADCDDVCQSTWAHVVAAIDTIRQPDRLRPWIVTVAKRESIKHLQFSARHVLVADVERDVREPGGCGPEEVVVQQVDHWRVRAALHSLPRRHQALLRLLVCDPAPTYDEISERLGIPRGSIGPTRNRILQRMRQLLEQDEPSAQHSIA
jgi:RNA polymerase sigma factor (sigma-70 family)